jgi:hypothetical protein
MKKIILITAGFITIHASAQVPVQGSDTTLKPAMTDSTDFKGTTFKKQEQQQAAPRRDSLPMDDRKPKNPPKKK